MAQWSVARKQPRPPAETVVEITGDMIRLGQLLKLGGLVDSGGDVRPILAGGEVTVNGLSETRRGRQLHHGDVVDFAGTRLRVAVVEG
jgi:ribosome-associated protein